MPSLDARATRIADYAKAYRDRPDFADAVKAIALAELQAAVGDETERCTALIRQAMRGAAESSESPPPSPEGQPARKRRR